MTPLSEGLFSGVLTFIRFWGIITLMMIFMNPGKSKKRKPTAKQRELAAEWDALVKKYEPKKPLVASVKPHTTPKPYVRETPKIPSLISTGGSTALKKSPVYTGNKLMGIGTMHKSNSVPIFSNDEAKDIATMRRG